VQYLCDWINGSRMSVSLPTTGYVSIPKKRRLGELTKDELLLITKAGDSGKANDRKTQ
jgi:hypothetical protein